MANLGNIENLTRKEGNAVDTNLVIDKYATTIDADGIGHVMVYIDGEELELGTIGNVSSMDGSRIHERAKTLLKSEGVVIRVPEPAPVESKPKRKYTRHVHLGLASEYGKVTLKIASDVLKQVDVYHLYLKGTNRFVYKLDERGIYLTTGVKTRPMNFTKEDIKLIKNISDFDVVKKTLEVKSNHIKNKIKIER